MDSTRVFIVRVSSVSKRVSIVTWLLWLGLVVLVKWL